MQHGVVAECSLGLTAVNSEDHVGRIVGKTDDAECVSLDFGGEGDVAVTFGIAADGGSSGLSSQ